MGLHVNHLCIEMKSSVFHGHGTHGTGWVYVPPRCRYRYSVRVYIARKRSINNIFQICRWDGSARTKCRKGSVHAGKTRDTRTTQVTPFSHLSISDILLHALQ